MITDLRKRIRSYEDAYRISLSPRTPTIIRVDGKAFHTLTKKLCFARPCDADFMRLMDQTACEMCCGVQGAKLAYVQSDEITLLLVDYDRYNTSPWFGKGLQKMCSVAASLATMAFNYCADQLFGIRRMGLHGMFDARVFCVPREEVCNVFVDRQQDCVRNSILACGQSVHGKKAIHGLSCAEILEMSPEWKQLPAGFRYGRIVERIDDKWSCSPLEYKLADQRWLVDKYVWPDDEEGRYSSVIDLRFEL